MYVCQFFMSFEVNFVSGLLNYFEFTVVVI